MYETAITHWARKHGIKPNGVVIVGASAGEEREEWQALTNRVIWYEANPVLWPVLERNVLCIPGHEVVRSAVGSKRGTIKLNVASAMMSSSPLPLGRHAVHYPQITYTHQVEVPVVDLDASLKGRYDEFDYLYMDLQGYEGEALTGAKEFLKHVKWVYTEYNKEEMYLGCWLLPQLTAYLEACGFKLAEMAELHPAWGDCLFIRE